MTRIDLSDPTQNKSMTPDKWDAIPNPCAMCHEDRRLGICDLVQSEHCAACHKSVCMYAGEDPVWKKTN